MSVFALGLNHTTAPLDLRGRFAFAPEQLAAALQAFRERLQRVAPEVAHRVDLQPHRALRRRAAARRDAGRARRSTGWPSIGGVARRPLRAHAYVLRGPRRGAPCVPRRQRARFDGARRAADPRPDEAGGARGRQRRHAGHARCTRCSSARSRWPRKCARSTEIGAHSISMAAAAVRLASQLFEDLRDTSVLFVGAGEMIELVATHFAARQPKAMAVANRTLRARREAGRPLRRRGDARWPTCRRAWPSSTSSSRAPRARCRSSAWAPSSAR